MSFRVSKNYSVSIDGDILPDDEIVNSDDQAKKPGWLEMFLSLFTTSPSDWLIIVNEWLEVIDWDAKSHTIAQPFGNLLTFLFYVIRLLQDNMIKPSIHKINPKAGSFDFSKSTKLRKYDYLNQYANDSKRQSTNELYYIFIGRLSKIFDVAVVLFLLLNLISSYRFLWGYFRTYQFFYLEEKPNSKNVTKHNLTNLNHRYVENASNGSFWSLLKYVFLDNEQKNKSNDDDCGDNEYFYQLKKWAPSKFTTSFFVSFSPTCIVFLLFTEVTFTSAFAVIIHQYIIYFLTVDRYENRIVDDSIVTRATLAEVDSKFTKPLLSKKVQDVMIDATPYGDGFVRFFPAVTSTKSFIFKTHSLTGDKIIEKYNTKTNEFEDIADNTNSHNVIVEPPQLNPYVLYRNPRDYDHYGHVREGMQHPFYHSREGSPNRMSTPPGFYSPVVSTASGMSTPYLRPERSTVYMNSVPTRQGLGHQNNFLVNDYPRKNSRSPLRQSLLSSRNTENMRVPNPDSLSDTYKSAGNSGFPVSSRSSSKSPTRQNKRVI